jgi:ribosome-binding factor A
MRRKSSQKSAKEGPSQRQLRVGEAIRHAITRVLREGNIRDPEVDGTLVTVTEVRASPDLKHASAFVTKLGGGESATMVKALNRASPYIRSEVAREVQLRVAPEIHFQVDTSFEQASRIDTLLRQPHVRRDLAKDSADDGEDP